MRLRLQVVPSGSIGEIELVLLFINIWRSIIFL